MHTTRAASAIDESDRISRKIENLAENMAKKHVFWSYFRPKSHVCGPIGMIFGHMVGPTVPHLHTKFQPPSSFTFWCAILAVKYTLFIFEKFWLKTQSWSKNAPNMPKRYYFGTFPDPNRPPSRLQPVSGS